MAKVVVVVSGGMDSATLLYHILADGHEARAISVDYGQRHVKELDYARQLCEGVGVAHQIADLSAINPIFGNNSLSGRDMEVPEGHYAEESMKQTVVPNRNMLLLSVAIASAAANKFDAVAYGAHSGDHAIYPDCRPEFAEAMDQAARLCDWNPIELWRPFVHMDKGQIAKRGVDLGVPFEKTWTCYKGLERHCGKCGACVERKEAFAAHGLLDPTEYAE
ncbi:7-cyano-7-deazaguanine synthase QueC [Blastopirellula marina]|uniref:7-cyano-7-deazaguanine synthase n=1 Tax=Blastopirellula marina TaxID=124 RepID=A0A2S8FHR7_9BACT|nr:7-cyano-7-deazaguanine synthase QueC [Blastopirellula marina]PQO31706.1 7-cyano-7-deazaguanine synthase QueC [Blastopirellula marina]PTL43013.1 7-cyano-7-deazaguanine synthase QueC [Blastopirellula marina]